MVFKAAREYVKQQTKLQEGMTTAHKPILVSPGDDSMTNENSGNGTQREVEVEVAMDTG